MPARGVRNPPPAGLFTFDLLDGLQVGLCQTHLRKAPAKVALERLVTAFMASPGPSIVHLSLRGHASMAQGILVWGSLIALLGLILVLVLNILLALLDDDGHTHGKRKGYTPSNQRDGFK